MRNGGSVLRAAAIVVAAAAAPCLVVVGYYASQGALDGLGEALFVRAFGQLAGNNPAHVRQLLSPSSFGMAIEGRLAGGILLAPLVVYAVLGVVLARRLWRGGASAETLFGGSLLLYGLATVSQGFTPPLVVRFLQAGAPVYLVVTWLAAMAARRSKRISLAAGLATASAGALLVWAVVAGIPRIDPTDSFTGCMRMRRGDVAVSVLGDVRADRKTAEEIRLSRDRRPRDRGASRPGDPARNRASDPPGDRLLDRVLVAVLSEYRLRAGGVGLSHGPVHALRALTVPFLLAIILHFSTVSPHTLRLGLQSAAIVALIAATFPMRESEARFMQKLTNGKRAWVEVYRDSHDIAAADRAARLKIYPWAPETTRLQEKLDHLEARRLNLFKE